MRDDHAVVGLSDEELAWVRLLVTLLRHTEPGTAELCKQALLYVDARHELQSASNGSGAV